MTIDELVKYIYGNTFLFAAVVALLLPFVVILVGLIINYLGYAIAFLASLFIDPMIVMNMINYLFFPGVMLHELSHAFLAFITGAEVTEVALFKREEESLGHVSFRNRGNLFLVSLQNVFASAAPMFCGGAIVFGCYYGVTHITILWLRILLGYLGVSMFFHMTMSVQDIKIYIKGVPIFMGLIFIVCLLLKLFGVI
ncbi:hypothetical protein SAMN06297422_10131 [Lachnospiraceae bacterium]|nr:hypothetical protein SAMN06297422_10131 [Lachnospiraceae bacterium]